MEPPTSRHLPDDDNIDLAELFGRLRRGLFSTLGLSFLGIALGVAIALILTLAQPAASTTRVTFSFPGFERGTYPNGTNFTEDDLRAPDVIGEAIRRLGLPGDNDLVSRIRGAISITGLVPASIVKERDRLLAAGQTPPNYSPDEFTLTLALPRNFSIGSAQKERLLTEIISVYREKFRRTYVELPTEFNNAFDSLKDADYPEYELVLNREMESLIVYLKKEDNTAGDFRSPSNGLSFQSLIKQADLFTRIRLNDVLSQIYVDGLTKNRSNALIKMDYYLRTLEDQEQRLMEQESVVTDLLKQSGDRSQNYVLASKTQINADKPVIDQGLINSLLANDSYNFLIHKALEAGTALKDVQADKARLLERKARMETFAQGEVHDQTAAIAAVQKGLTALESDYNQLLVNVRMVLSDYAQQQYAHAIRITQPPATASLWKSLVVAAVVGLCVGGAFGIGLSLLRPHRP